MASGQFIATKMNSGYQYIYANWTSTSDVASNSSLVTVDLYLSSVASLSSSVSKNVSITIDGTTYSGTTTVGCPAGGKWLFSASKTVYHDANGTKSIGISAVFDLKFTLGGTFYNSTSLSGTATLDTIPRYLVITSCSIINVTRNSCQVSYSTDKSADWAQYSLNGGAWTNYSSNISGLSAGTYYTVNFRLRATDSQLWTESGNMGFTTVAAASANTPTVSDITRNSITLSWSSTQTVNGIRYGLSTGSYTEVTTSGTWGQYSISSGISSGGNYTVYVSVRDAVHWTWSGWASKTFTAQSPASSNTPTLSSITCIQATMGWSSNLTATGLEYKIGSGSWTAPSSGGSFSASTSGSFTITGLSPNTSYAIYTRVKDAVSGTYIGTASGSLSIKTVALSTANYIEFNLGSNPTFTLTLGNSAMNHKVTLMKNNGVTAYSPVVSTSAGVTTGSLVPNASTIQNENPTINNVPLSIKIESYWGATKQGEVFVGALGKIVDANPTLNGTVTYSDTNSTVVSKLGTPATPTIVKGKSTLRVSIPQATGNKGATISTYRVNVAGKEANVTASTGVHNIDVGTIDNVVNTATITVFDSRGNSSSTTINITVLDYYFPNVVSVSATRLNNYEEQSYLSLRTSRPKVIPPAGTDKNTLSITYKIYLDTTLVKNTTTFTTTDTTSGNVTNTNNTNDIGTYISTNAYRVEYIITDMFESRTYNIILPQGIALMSYKSDKIVAGLKLEMTKGFIATGTNIIVGTAASQPLKVRGIQGTDGNEAGIDGELFLNYGNTFDVYINGSNKVWHAGNDGSGSGLDADLLDGKHASAFALSSHSHTEYVAKNTAIEVPYAVGTQKPMIVLTGATSYGLFHREGSTDEFAFKFNGTDRIVFKENGNLSIDGSITLPGSVTLYKDSSYNSLTVTNPNGSIQIGPLNSGTCHLYTDRPSFYFNKELIVNGNNVFREGGSYGTIYLSNWYRSSGTTGWYNETYNGGWYMTDANWVRSYANKGVHTGAALSADGGLTLGQGSDIRFIAAPGTPTDPGDIVFWNNAMNYEYGRIYASGNNLLSRDNGGSYAGAIRNNSNTCIDHGTVSLTNASWTSVSFYKTFIAAPRVLLTSTGTAGGMTGEPKTRNITTTGFEVQISGTAQSYSYCWMAIYSAY